MGSKSVRAAVALSFPLAVVLACEAQSHHPSELGDCTASSTEACNPITGSSSGGGVLDGATGDSAQQDASDAIPCMNATANVLYLAGTQTDPIYPGQVTITQGTFTPMAVDNWQVTLDVIPSMSSQGSSYTLEFSTLRPNTPPFMVGDYPNAYPTPYPGQNGLNVEGNGSNCTAGNLGGAFQVYAVDIVSGDGGVDAGADAGPATLLSFTAAFTTTCVGGADVLSGCIHYQM
jgi:hypothetical protein